MKQLRKRLLAGVLATALLLNNMSTLAYAMDEGITPPPVEQTETVVDDAAAQQAAADEAARQAAEQAAAEEAARQAAEQAAAEQAAADEAARQAEEQAAAEEAARQAAAEEAARQAAEQKAAEEAAAKAAAEKAAAEQAAQEAQEAMASSNAGTGPSIEEPVTTPAPKAKTEEPAEEPEPAEEADIDTGALAVAPAVAQLTTLPSDAGVSVKAVVPAGTKLNVSGGDTGAATAAIAAALPEGFVPADVQVWEITLTDAAGNKAEMTGDAVVTLPAAVAQNSAVYYIHDGVAEKVADLAAGANSFTVSHFSTYAVAAQEKAPASEPETEDETEPAPEPTPESDPEPEDEPDTGLLPAPETKIATPETATPETAGAAEVTVTFKVAPVEGTAGEGWTLTATAPEGEPVTMPTKADFAGFPEELELGGWYLDETMTQSVLDAPAIAAEGATFYAIAIDPENEYDAMPLAGTKEYDIEYAIYVGSQEGEIYPQEPTGHTNGNYSESLRLKDGFKYYNPAMLVSNNHGESFVYNYWFKNDDVGVKDALLWEPDAAQINKMLQGKRGTSSTHYDPNTQYIVWYIIKEQANDLLKTDISVHVDGIIRTKQFAYLDFNANDNNGGAELPRNVFSTQRHIKGETFNLPAQSPKWGGIVLSDGLQVRTDRCSIKQALRLRSRKVLRCMPFGRI